MNANNRIEALSVTDVNRYIKALINADDLLSSVAIRGEISNFKRHSAGHLYFSLKDDGGEISAIMFRADAARMNFNPVDGMRVVAFGNVDVYEKNGRYQVYVRTMISDGVGAMAQAYERLKKKLEAEGLFAAERKKPLPAFPKKIGIITAPTGAAIRDMLNVTGRRYPQAEILIYPSLVQGADAPSSLKGGIEYLNADRSCDVIIIGRGGGSIEDLWAFNDEALARAIAASDIPVVSAVGHETDFTLCDFVADCRAPTPSAAAELVVPDVRALCEYVEQRERSMLLLSLGRVNTMRSDLLRKRELLEYRSPAAKLDRTREEIKVKLERANASIDRKYDRKVAEFSKLVEKLSALDPMAILQRGYGALKREDGTLITKVSDLNKGDRINVIMRDGSATATVESVAIKDKV